MKTKDFKDKDVMEWLHEIRAKMYEEEIRKGISGEEWMKGITKQAEKILGHRIRRIREEKVVL